MKQFSYSKIKDYLDCPRKYKLKRIDKLKTTYKSSAFIFGTAIDEASEILLGTKEGNYKEVFLDNMTNSEINGIDTYIPTSINVKYFAKDLQLELLDDELLKDLDEPEEFVRHCKDAIKKGYIEEEDHILYNKLCWTSLVKKGELLLEKFKEWIEENIEETYYTQKSISLKSDSNELVGFLDFKAKFKDGTVRICDLKTASDPIKQYPNGCIEDSMQLTIYATSENHYEVAYYVLDKSVRKREPRIRDRFIKGVISKEVEDKHFNTIENVIGLIDANVFPKNENSCYNYGGCEFLNYCRNGCMEGLKKC